ncbi:MAG: Gfo/Idh/MocA family oxidoreductase [Balneolales bacterium]
MKEFDRRKFIKSVTAAGVGMSIVGSPIMSVGKSLQKKTTVGVIGLDTSHSTAFTKAINDPDGGADVSDFEVIAAYPWGSRNIKASGERIPGYTEEMVKMGVEIVDSIDELLTKVDVVLLETNDGNPHLEQALPVMKAGKPMFIDKPITGSLKDAVAIIEASKQYNTPIFSSSSLRYMESAQAVRNDNTIGEVLGADTFSPASLEESHPDLFWYGIHGVEILYTVMGAGCQTVTRTHTEGTDVVVGTWDKDRIGTFRGIRNGRGGYGGTAYGSEDIATLGPYGGYRPLVVNILEFFRTGISPVDLDETLEIYAFMEAADESKRQGGLPVNIDDVLSKARA